MYIFFYLWQLSTVPYCCCLVYRWFEIIFKKVSLHITVHVHVVMYEENFIPKLHFM